ncbi:ATP-grasp domain-containing protein [Nesterenkonia xinjiangensis]|uniref:D-alanine-D-alanine ligase-like ATP-grasp enzyme n=1 Tax=Nesterenkonia xinjiangensis TaxID=225327 RepID=A0A7Z0K994_9MICC|nr:ATP-grasp domain-containing protein [Nesterenkonia xinjiangensis]NYJ76985.1 D-alanine-D-alanine ligase-like ATP-grasp enzyme [Nesterenkonia xinjiangensis]
MDLRDVDVQELIWSPTLNRVAGQLAATAGARDGGEVTWLSTRQGVLQSRGRRYLIDGAINHESSVAALIVDDKELARRFLRAAGVSTPQGRLVMDADEAVAWAESRGAPVVVKPRVGSAGRGVSVRLTDPESIVRAFHRAAKHRQGVVVEEQIEFAEEYRCLVTPQRCFAVVRRVLPRVIGDGVRSLEALIDAKNEERRRNPMLERIPIPKDSVVDTVLAAQGLDLTSVVNPGHEVLVRNVGGISGGGEPHEVSDTVDPRVPRLAVEAAKAIPGLHWGGVDVVIDQRTGAPCVLEANVSAGYGGATHPVQGRPQDVAGAIWEIRREQGSTDAPLGRAAPPAPAAPCAVRDEVPEDWPDGTNGLLLGDVMRAVLAADGWGVTSWGAVKQARDGAGSELWFLRSGPTTQDMLSTRRILRRHELVRQLLGESLILRPRGAVVSNAEDCRRIFADSTAPLVLTPPKARWGDPRQRRLRLPEAVELLEESKGEWLVQTRPAGARIRLYATRDEVLWVTAARRQELLPEEVIETAARAAVRAVRSVPELRWAPVDVVIPRRAAGRPWARPLVEGMVSRPKLVAGHQVIGGSLVDLVRWIAQNSSSVTASHPLT